MVILQPVATFRLRNPTSQQSQKLFLTINRIRQEDLFSLFFIPLNRLSLFPFESSTEQSKDVLHHFHRHHKQTKEVGMDWM